MGRQKVQQWVQDRVWLTVRNIVKRKIEQAFPVEPVPSPSDAIADTYLVEHLHEILGGRRWPDLTPENYRHCSDGFSLLNVAGLHYYLPGYLVAELTDHEQADVVAEHWISSLGDKSQFGKERMEELGQLVTANQIEAITLWVAYYANQYGTTRDVRRCYERLESWADDVLQRHVEGKTR